MKTTPSSQGLPGHLSGSAFCGVDIGLPEQAGSVKVFP